MYRIFWENSQESWNYDPFGAHKDEQGNIFGRGTQDMKSVGMQYLAAIKKLKDEKYQPKRTIHLLYVPGIYLLFFYFSNFYFSFSDILIVKIPIVLRFLFYLTVKIIKNVYVLI